VRTTGDEVLNGLCRSYLFEDLTSDELAPLASVVTTRQYVRGEYVWRVGDPADEICVVLHGEVKDSVLDADGFELVHFVHGTGMTFGEPGYFAVDRHRVVANIALEPTQLIKLPRRELQPFIERHPVIKDRALERLASDMRWQSTMIISIVRRSLADRIALRLLELVDSSKRADGRPVTPKISQSTLAAMIGVSRENVNRALAGLVGDGLVRYDRGRYVIVDEVALRERIGRDWPSVLRRDRRLV
jgi:CRP/FNR family transcriptional regulator, cyclic AMP receptor protein